MLDIGNFLSFLLFSFKETENLQQKILFSWGGHFQFIPDVMKKNNLGSTIWNFLKILFKCQYNVYKNIFITYQVYFKICHYFTACKKIPSYLKECLTPFDHEWGLSKLKTWRVKTKKTFWRKLVGIKCTYACMWSAKWRAIYTLWTSRAEDDGRVNANSLRAKCSLISLSTLHYMINQFLFPLWSVNKFGMV